jgi:pseudouridine-5'-phosphate glycosidase
LFQKNKKKLKAYLACISAILVRMKSYLNLHPEVMEALEFGAPVVALESTIIAHGMPYPENIIMAKEVGQIIRNAGAVPATVACIDGKICVGLSDTQLDTLAHTPVVMKVSRRELPYALAKKKLAATTVSATMIGAHMAGIRVFVTGGIGGVHRGWADSLDISTDLIELSQTPVAVVSAGAKAILDIPATLELLETLGVPVISYRSSFFGAFYSSESSERIEMRLDSASEIAAFLDVKWKLGLQGGALISNPIPKNYEVPKDLIESVIEEAIGKAHFNKVKGKQLTPFLLSEIKKVTDGRSLEANIQLVKNNARLGTEIALALAAAHH